MRPLDELLATAVVNQTIRREDWAGPVIPASDFTIIARVGLPGARAGDAPQAMVFTSPDGRAGSTRAPYVAIGTLLHASGTGWFLALAQANSAGGGNSAASQTTPDGSEVTAILAVPGSGQLRSWIDGTEKAMAALEGFSLVEGDRVGVNAHDVGANLRLIVLPTVIDDDEAQAFTRALDGSRLIDASVYTPRRSGVIGEVSVRGTERITIEGNDPGEGSALQLMGLTAGVNTDIPVAWRWWQVSGPEVELRGRGQNRHFQVPALESDGEIVIAAKAEGVLHRIRSDWHLWRIPVRAGRVWLRDTGGFTPYRAKVFGYSRDHGEIWNEAVSPEGFMSRLEAIITDLGITLDDVIVSEETPLDPPANALWVNPATGEVSRNIASLGSDPGSMAAPRKNAAWLHPETGDLLVWDETAGPSPAPDGYLRADDWVLVRDDEPRAGYTGLWLESDEDTLWRSSDG